ncbi:MAG: nucleotidyltransferase family protein [Bacteroidales bacterium]|nr:nucleotidyltransferase family protein [Bacteroidales bacterium]
MKAMIFAAGKGTRLRPLTDTIPKALVKIKGISMLEIVIRKLIENGFDEIIINLHHFPEQIIDFVEKKKYFGIKIEFSIEDEKLLNTGGGLTNTKDFFNDDKDFLLHNVDILSEVNLKNVYKFHLKNNALATLIVKKRQTSRYLLFDENNLLAGWENIKTGERIISREFSEKLIPLAFSGIHFINPRIFDLIDESGSFSIIDLYLRLSKTQKIMAYDIGNTFWLDIGKPEELEFANLSCRF